MPRTIPIAIADQIASRGTTMCGLLKITPVQPGFDPFGVTSLDVDVHYDDGTGSLLYSAAIGTDVSTLQASSDLGIAGGESKQLMPVFDTPISEKSLAAGACDYAKFVAYAVNYNDLTSGRHIILQTGTLGKATVTDSGLTWTSELRGLTQKLKQLITEKWSLTCRAVFGSTVASAQSRYPCNFDISTLWQTGTVERVGIDTTQDFSTTDVSPSFGGAPGAVEWLTGDNAGRTDETETCFAVIEVGFIGHRFGLTFGASYAIQVGDTFRFRDDCPKTPVACQARSNYQNYRGEPSIPVADNGALSIGNIGGAVTTTTDGG